MKALFLLVAYVGLLSTEVMAQESAAASQPAAAASQSEGKENKGSGPYRKALEIYKRFKDHPAKIIGGEDAKYEDFSWQVALVRSDVLDNFYAHFCGAVLLGDGWIVTAAHCVDSGMKGSMLRVIAGTNLLQGSDGREEVEEEIRIVPGFDATYFKNDVALLRLRTARPAQKIRVLMKPDDRLTDENPPDLIVVGWGYLYEWGLKSQVLKQIDLKLPTLSDCKKVYGGLISADMFCAGKDAMGKDACRGDSGGAAVLRDAGGKPVLAGLVSWAIKCGDPHRFGVYVRLSQFTDWIQRETQLTLNEPK